MSEEAQLESVEDFRQRARDWLAENMTKLPEGTVWNAMDVGPKDADRAKALQRKLYEGGFAGICFPKEYGGQGLTREHQQAFTDECRGYEMPLVFNTPTFTIIAPTILDMGTEEQKKQYLPGMIRGDHLWVQFMSEPSGGSDLAGAITSARWDGENYLLNGSKIWSSYAYFSDYAICLARTDWDAIKHQGLSMFIVKIDQPGITVNQIKQSDEGVEFCQEFFDDVPIPPENLLGTENDGWTVGQRLLYHERSAVGGSSPYASGVAGRRQESMDDLVQLARQAGNANDPRVRDLLAEAHVLHTVQSQTVKRITNAIAAEAMPSQAGAILRLFGGVYSVRKTDIAYEIAGDSSVAWDAGESPPRPVGVNYVFRQASCIGGGTTEMQRNIISERVLGMPREPAADRGVPFKEVRRNKPA